MTENIQLSCHIYLKNDLGYVWSTTHYNPLKHFILNEYRNNIYIHRSAAILQSRRINMNWKLTIFCILVIAICMHFIGFWLTAIAALIGFFLKDFLK